MHLCGLLCCIVADGLNGFCLIVVKDFVMRTCSPKMQIKDKCADDVFLPGSRTCLCDTNRCNLALSSGSLFAMSLLACLALSAASFVLTCLNTWPLRDCIVVTLIVTQCRLTSMTVISLFGFVKRLFVLLDFLCSAALMSVQNVFMVYRKYYSWPLTQHRSRV